MNSTSFLSVSFTRPVHSQTRHLPNCKERISPGKIGRRFFYSFAAPENRGTSWCVLCPSISCLLPISVRFVSCLGLLSPLIPLSLVHVRHLAVLCNCACTERLAGWWCLCGDVLECTVFFGGRLKWSGQITVYLRPFPSIVYSVHSRLFCFSLSLLFCCPVRPDARERINISSAMKHHENLHQKRERQTTWTTTSATALRFPPSLRARPGHAGGCAEVRKRTRGDKIGALATSKAKEEPLSPSFLRMQ